MFFSGYINNVTALQSFQLVRFGTLLLISIVFTKTHLSISEIGIYETLLFISGALCFFWLQGLIQSLLPLYKSKNLKEKSPALFNAFILTLLFSFLAFVFVTGFKNQIGLYSGNTAIIPYLDIFAFFILLNGPASLVEYVYLLHDRPGMIIRYGLVSFTLHFLFVAMPVITGYGLELSIYGLVLITVIRIVWLLFLIHKYSCFRISFEFIRVHFSVGYPLILGALLGGSAQYIDDFIVSHFTGSAEFAIYKYGSKQFPLIVLLSSAFSNAMAPVFASRETTGALQQIKERSVRLMHILFPATIVLLLTSKWLYPVIFNPRFLPGADIFNVLLLLVFSFMVFPQTILIGLKKTKLILTASLLELILHIGLSLVFIRLFGIIGVAVATVIAYFFEKILLLVFLYIRLKITPAEFIPARQYIFYTILLISAFIFTVFL